MPRIWTHGVWTAKPGRADDFVASWQALVPVGERLGSGDPVLLRDRVDANVFRSFGPWPDLDAIERFRAELGPRMRDLSDALERFEVFTLDEVYPGD